MKKKYVFAESSDDDDDVASGNIDGGSSDGDVGTFDEGSGLGVEEQATGVDASSLECD